MRVLKPSTPDSPAPRRSPFASFANVQFRWLYASNAAFFFAMMGQMVVRSYLAFDITGSAFALGLVNLMVALPMLAIAPFGGVMADRVERRKLIMIGQATVLAAEIVILVLLVSGLILFWHLLAVTFVMGCVFPFIMPARQAIVANIVGRRGLQNAMALQMGAMNAARVVSPALAGFLMWAAGISIAYSVAVVLYGLALLSMTRVDRSAPPQRMAATTVLADIVQGMRYAAGNPVVRILLIVGLVPVTLAMPFQQMLPVFTEEVWHVNELGLGVLHAAAGAGGLAGAMLIAAFGETRRKLRLMTGSLLGFGLSLAAFALSPYYGLAVGLVFIADIFVAMFQTTNSTLIQVVIPDEVRGRIMSLMMMTFGLTPLGTVPIAAAAQAWGAPVAVAGACGVMLLAGAIFLAASRSLRNIDAAIAEALATENENDERRLAALPAGPIEESVEAAV